MSPALAGGFFTAEPPGKPVGELTLLLAGSSARTNSQGPHSSPQGPLHRLLRLLHSVESKNASSKRQKIKSCAGKLWHH